jgi:hypothetical protein
VGAIIGNAIRPDGTILGLKLASSDELIVRDDDGRDNASPASWSTSRLPIPIEVHDHFAMSDTGILRLVFESDPWNSLISFEPGIPVQLGGTLELKFAADVNVLSQLGRTLRIFDWTGVMPTGKFGIESQYLWDLSRLYTFGEVTLVAIPEPTTGLLIIVASAATTFLRNRRNCSASHI